MTNETSSATRTLNHLEILDLARAGLVLAITVALALIVPPKVFGAESVQNDMPAIEAAK